jgi:hypothetical protein
VFRATVWPSFPICYGSPMLGLAGARFVMVWMKMQSAWLFVPIALFINVVMVVVGTRGVVSTHLSRLRRDRGPALGTRDRRQELLLFLRTGRRDDGQIDERLLHMIREIMLALEYSGAGRVEGYGTQQGFSVVQMAGPSAEGLFGALGDLLAGISIVPGSFAVMRYGDGSQEKVIEL